MTNKTIAVPRDFFEVAVKLCHLLGIPPLSKRADELRALLDAPVVNTDVRTILLDVVSGDGNEHEIYAKSCADVERVLTELWIRIEDMEGALRPTAQPQGEPVPVAWMRFDDDQKAIFTKSKRANKSEPLYAHPTAYRHTTPTAQPQPAPVALVLPVRYDESQYRGTSLLAVRRWNACLDEVAKLNGVKP